MLLPSAGSIAIYDSSHEVLWCSDGYAHPDLRALLDRLSAASPETLAGRGSVEMTAGGVPAFVAALKSEHSRPLGAVVLELRNDQAPRQTGSLLSGLLRPVLDCLESRLTLENTLLGGDRDAAVDGVDLLLSVDEDDREDAGALRRLLKQCVTDLGCVLGALSIPDKNLSISCAPDDSVKSSQLLDRTQRHLLAWAQLNNRPMVVNRVGSASEVAPYKILTCPIRDLQSRVVGIVALFRSTAAPDFELRDIRILEFVSRKTVGVLRSQHDGLTGLINRLIFERRVRSLLDGSDSAPHSLLYIDIDKLEAVNQTFGLHAGDEVIRRVAEVIVRAAGDNALVSRIGGDRFAVFLPERSAAEADEVGSLIIAATARLGYMSGADTVPVSVSIGVVGATRSDRVGHLLASAEVACKRAKSQGRSRLVVHDEDTALLPARRREMVAWESLQEAFKTNDFRLESQPIMGLRAPHAEPLAHEVFIRMRNAGGELIAADKFLAAAERYELLPALDRWVLCTLTEIAKTSPPEAARCLTLNVSAQSLASGKYAAFALEQIERAGLSPSMFCFELNESAAVSRLSEAEQLIRELTRAGSKIALDDFGYGLSSLAHLKRLPVQYLKIDGRFVRRILDDRVAESIVSGIARAAKTLGVGVIAEHVENAALADKLRELDVEYGQGFHLGRPRPLLKVVEERAPMVAVRSGGS
ncbi:MAG TPA: EAL domain-containing protein [Gammaproteobacteria bacterium]|nr:EAL domain-containing protein [Gammaproteobacteria bacterium]